MGLPRLVVVGALVAGALVVSLGGLPVAGAPASARAAPVPPHGRVLLGAYVSPDGHVWRRASVSRLERHLGRDLAIDHRYKHWTDAFPAAADAWDHDRGRIPMITWMPDGPSLAAIAAGRADRTIAARARAVAKDGRPMFLRFGHEMNADWYPWGGARNGGATGRGATDYVAAFRHVHARFEQAGATNVRWVWSPNHRSIPAAAWNAADRYYPGNDVVDWVGIDGYDRTPRRRTSFAAVFGPAVSTLAHAKPVMIAETGTDHTASRRAAGAWIDDARRAIETRYPSVRALVWFDTKKGTHDWRVDGSGPAGRAFRALARDPVFGGTRP